jgi:hypothetical protein
MGIQVAERVRSADPREAFSGQKHTLMTYLASPYSLKNSRGSILVEFLLLPMLVNSTPMNMEIVSVKSYTSTLMIMKHSYQVCGVLTCNPVETGMAQKSNRVRELVCLS